MLHEEKKTTQYPYSRRQFIKGIGALGMLSTIPWWSACQVKSPVTEGALGKHSQLAIDVLKILFPKDGLGPSSTQINAYPYLNWVLSDVNYDADIKKSIAKGFEQLADFSKAHYNRSFSKLSKKKKISLIATATQTAWGKNLMSRLVSMIMDALVLDPIYEINTNEVGWSWLQHNAGHPRVNQTNRYPEILDRKQELVIISDPKDL